MYHFCKIFILIFSLPSNAKVKGQACLDDSNEYEKCAYVVSHTFCEAKLAPEDRVPKNTLEEVHTYAELRNDPRSSLPHAFTICSTFMATDCQSPYYPIFFNLLDNQKNQLLAPFIEPSIESRLGIELSTWSTSAIYGKIRPTFPNKWTKSCVAINSTSGDLVFMVEGTLILALNYQDLKDTKKIPKSLNGKIILGAKSYGGKWYSLSNKVANLNIFSSFLPEEDMKRMTKEEHFVREGDYLSWKDMEWILHGQAKMENVPMLEPCEGDPPVNLYYTPFPGWESCMHHCEKLGSRNPSLATFEDWLTLQTFLKGKLFGRGLNELQIWLSITDEQTEGVWSDFYGTKMENYTHPWMGLKPDGGVGQNCARLVDENTWSDSDCDWKKYGCMCSYRPTTFLKLRGLCLSSAVDIFYKPINQWNDIRKLTFHGLKHSSITYDERNKVWNLTSSDLR